MKARLPGLVLLVIALVYGLQAMQIPVPAADAAEAMTPRTLPLGLAVSLALIGAVLLIRPAPSAIRLEDTLRTDPGLWLRATALLGIGLVFAALIDPLGVLVSSTLSLAAALVVMGVRRPLILILVPVGFSGMLWLLLVVVLGLWLHPGDWWTDHV